MSPANRDAEKAALWTVLFTFVGTFALTALTWLQEVAVWASTSGQEPLPGLSILGYGAVSAAVAGASGFVNWLVRALQAAGKIPGAGPRYPDAIDTTGHPKV